MKDFEVLQVRRVATSAHLYYPVDVLVYAEPGGHELALAVHLEGELSEDHGAVLDRLDAGRRLGLSVGEPASALELDPALLSLVDRRPDVTEPNTADSAGSTEILGEDAAADELLDKSAGAAEPQVRSVSVYEHPLLLAEALESARKRLLIVSPWVKRAVVTEDFVSKVERLLRSRVAVTIAHGYGADDSGSDDDALRRLEKLAGRYPSLFRLARLTNGLRLGSR